MFSLFFETSLISVAISIFLPRSLLYTLIRKKRCTELALVIHPEPFICRSRRYYGLPYGAKYESRKFDIWLVISRDVALLRSCRV